MKTPGKGLICFIVLFILSGMILTHECLAGTIRDSMKLYDRGKSRFDRGKYEDAIDYFKQAINDCPESAMTAVSMYYLGKSYMETGMKKEAGATFSTLIEKYESGEWTKWAKQDMKEIQ